MSLFDTQLSRKPNNYPWAKEIMDKCWAGHWTANEFSFTADVQHLNFQMTPEESEVVKKSMAAIAQVEIAPKTKWRDIGNVFPQPYIIDLGCVFANQEVIHNEAYGKVFEVAGWEDYLNSVLEIPVMRDRLVYLKKHLEKRYPQDQRKQEVLSLILFALFIEDVSLFSQFYIPTFFNSSRGLLTDIATQIKYTSREETLHALAGTMLINTLRVEHPELFDEDLKNKVKEASEEAFEYECAIIDWMVGDFEATSYTKEFTLKLSTQHLKEFVKNRINIALGRIGYEGIGEVDRELLKDTEWFDAEVIGDLHTDFFASRDTGYSMAHRDFNNEELF